MFDSREECHPDFKASQLDQDATITRPDGEMVFLDTLAPDEAAVELRWLLDPESAMMLRALYEQEHFAGYEDGNHAHMIAVAKQIVEDGIQTGWASNPPTYAFLWMLGRPLTKALMRLVVA